MRFTFPWLPVACKEGFWKEAFDVLEIMQRKASLALAYIVPALRRLPLQLMTSPFPFTYRITRVQKVLSW
jgi:hypothetical protein